MKYAYRTFALGGILAGSLIAAPAYAHGDKYSRGDDTSQSYSWNDDTFSSSDEGTSFSMNDESPQSTNDSDPGTIANDQLRQDQENLARDMSSGAADDQIARDQRAIEMDQQGAQDSVAFSGEGGVTMGPSS
ncbi:MAG TPA: hypothetical protein VL754_16425 [Verrucomicrobiae bacterium]|jgi:hypothetical protein|nr:hypothetical protein [Verrucomicrobiae bacterium]